MGKVIGIDLGTTNSCVAVIEGVSAAGQPEVKVVPNPEGARTTPSVVAFAGGGDRLVGQVAKRQAATNPGNTLFAVKRLMGKKFNDPSMVRDRSMFAYNIIEHENGDAWVEVQERHMSPPEVSSFVLSALKETVESFLGETVSEAVITVPAYFDDAQRQATKDAGRIAGLDVKRILNEPTAAALAYGLDKQLSERIAVYDLGGGTFDISIMQIQGGVFSVQATGGDTHLGGEDFDNRLIDKLADEFNQTHQIDLRANRTSLQRLREAAEKAKHELSSSIVTDINIPFVAVGPSGPLHLQISLKRSDLEILTRDLVERTISACKEVLKDAKLRPDQIDQVVLVGGMTRMPLVQRSVRELFGKDPHKGVNPDEVVAVGAAIQGAALSGAIDEVLLLDVAPLSIGVETGGAVFTCLIPRNTTVPTERSEIFTTSVDNQTFVPIHVLQGEREMAADNRSLARFELTKIPPAPRGVPKIQVTFSVDAEGILSVEAKDIATGRSQAVSVTPTSGLTKDEIDRLVTEGEQYKDADQARRELAEVRNLAEALLYTTEQALESYADLLPAERVDAVKNDVETLRGLLANSGDVSQIRASYAALEQATFEIAEAMYGPSSSST